VDIKNILITGNYEEEFKIQLPPELSKEFRYIPVENITEEDLAWADVYVGSKPCLNFDLSKLNWVHTFNAGVNNYLEIEGWQKHNVLLTRTVCSFGERISEYCLSYVLKDLQYHQQFMQHQRDKKWLPKTPMMIKNQTFVVFGTGEIGQEVARTFSQFGATVYGVSQSGEQKDEFTKVVKMADSSEFLSKADWLISTLPLTKDTHLLFNQAFFKSVNGASFINVGRGATVDEDALIQALDAKKIRNAVLDVLTEEPLPENSLLWDRDDVVITPHISAVTDITEAIKCFLETMSKVENNEPLRNKVDFSKGY
jgi:phosphoglycerate dehydrogenase-like enzyme